MCRQKISSVKHSIRRSILSVGIEHKQALVFLNFAIKINSYVMNFM